ncbi:DNA primase [Neogemmobacter tilapiae]|uniref:DNA primase n=1 Tax=Neogemmobacter tilapiae TaxID=875041 RepID=A0A918WJC7_9RHOB|nr:DNA primase [Gemmobacter tilapiae]GHC48244.1 DNA primase [Gemmobacter tilapiae]
MSLPPGFLDELRNRVSLSSVVGRKVTWDARKSNIGKGDMWAPCPFHQEKSASFHVDDRKGFYYCFGCHAKGDAVTFLKESENLSFIEAVEVLAREAGMPMPERDERAAQVADRRTQLAQVTEEAVKWFRLQLKTNGASEARDYLERRRLPVAAQDRWEIGWNPENRQGLFQALQQKGFATDLILDSGVCAKTDDGSIYDRFRGRIIFPIRDARGRCISFGGRSLDPNARAKYLNGPETALFDKGRNLFNHGPARTAAGKGQPLIVAEGYMDVIALSEAGFTAAVAPLGTAVTEEQLHLIWRIAPEPIIALDGDKAGIRAALRVVDLALPLIQAGQGLRFAVLPGGMDPDDLIKAQGAGAMQKVLDQARPMVDLLWERETEGKVFDSPERKAALEKDLDRALAKIRDGAILGHYKLTLRDLLWNLFNAKKRSVRWSPTAKGKGPAVPVAASKSSPLAQGDGAADMIVLESVLLATLVTHPALIHRFESDLEMLDFAHPDHFGLCQCLLRHADAGPDFHVAIADEQRTALERLFQEPHVQIAPPVRNRQDRELAALCVAEGLAKIDARRAARQEIEDAMQDVTGLVDEGLTWRVGKAAEARNQSERSDLQDQQGNGEDRAALSRALQDMIDQQVWVKPRR